MILQTFDPKLHSARDVYKLLIEAVVPRPIAFVSSISERGVRNLAPFSFFTVVSANPPMICFCPMVDSAGQPKDTLRNIRATGEFVVNIVTEEFLAQMNQCSAAFPPEVDEFAVSGLTALPSVMVKPPRVAESPLHLECVLNQIVDVSTNPLGGSIVIGEVKLLHVAGDAKHPAIGRMVGNTYVRATDLFDLKRPS